MKKDELKSTKEVDKPKSSRRNRRPNNKKYKDNEGKVSKKDFSAAGSNDISWYAQDATLLRNTANFPWSTQAGLTYDDTHTVIGTSATSLKVDDFTSPGIYAMHVLPGLGNTEYQLDAVNVSANAMYVFIRHMNSGAKNYDSPDLMNYILAMDEVFTCINFCQRLYGTLGMYSVYNRYVPDALIKMQGIDPDDLRENMVQFRYRLNTIIKQAATLVVPAAFPVFNRHAFLFNDYYIEGNDMKDQIYLYTPINFRKFEIPSGGGPGQLNYDALQTINGTNYYRLEFNHLLTGEKLLDYLQDMVSRIYLDEDFGIMAGDILKAYGEGGVVRLSELPDSYVCTLKQNNEVLLQMKNANVAYGAWTNMDSTKYANPGGMIAKFGNIEQDVNTNRIFENLQLPQIQIDATECLDYDHHLITLEGDPSPEMNMIMTRMTHDYTITGLSGAKFVRYICGTELVCNVSVCTDVDTFSYFYAGNGITLLVNDPASATFVSTQIAALSSFKYHCNEFLMAVNVYPVTDVTDVVSIRRVFQVDNFTFITRDMLDRLHQVAIMSEFNVPHMALIS